MPANQYTTIDLTNRFYCNVDIDSEVAMKLVTLAIRKAIAEHAMQTNEVRFDAAEYNETVEAIKYVFGVAREHGLINDRFLFAAASDSYNDVLLTGKFQTEFAHAVCEEFSISPEPANWLTKFFRRHAPIRFYLPQGPENQRLSIEKLLKVIEHTAGFKESAKARFEENHNLGKFSPRANFLDTAEGVNFGANSPNDNARFQR